MKRRRYILLLLPVAALAISWPQRTVRPLPPRFDVTLRNEDGHLFVNAPEQVREWDHGGRHYKATIKVVTPKAVKK